MKEKTIKTKRGDTIIEVLIAVAIFSAVAVSSMSIMNRGLANVETALEETVARTEIDYQADLIRFVYNGYLASPSKYKDTWEEMVASTGGDKTTNTTCSENKLQSESGSSLKNSFVLTSTGGAVSFQKKTTYDSSGTIPRAENGNNNSNIWVTVDDETDYYNFHINTCWYAPGSSTGTTLYTIIKLTNPDKL